MANTQLLNIHELSVNEHKFNKYHFCRGNSNKRKSRFGLVEKGTGTYMYLNKKLSVKEGDIVFIPEQFFCYSEWHGTPEVKVTYISCFINYGADIFKYEPQIIYATKENWDTMLKIGQLLKGGILEGLEAYSLFYNLLGTFIPNMKQSNLAPNHELQTAIHYIINNWKENFSVADIAKECCVCESKLYHLFKEQLGQTPITYLNSIKINFAIEYLEKGKYSISEISRMANFKSENHFRKVFHDITGTTPLKYRKGL